LVTYWMKKGGEKWIPVVVKKGIPWLERSPKGLAAVAKGREEGGGVHRRQEKEKGLRQGDCPSARVCTHL